MADEEFPSLQTIGGKAVAPSRELQVALMFDLGKRIGNEMSDDDLRSSFIFNYHLSSLDDILRKGLVEFSAGGLRLSSVGKTLNGITFAISESFSMLDYSGQVEQLKRNIDDLPKLPDFHYRWQRKRLIVLGRMNQKKKA